MKSIAIIGTGAIGSYYGIQLLLANNEVHFLFNSDYNHVKTHGLTLETATQKIHLPQINCYQNPREMPKCDLIIIALKTTANDQLPNILPHLIQPNSLILNLQNGIDTHKDIRAITPHNKLFSGLCSIACNKISPGYIKHIDFNEILLGEFFPVHASPNTFSEEILKIASLFQNAGVKISLCPDIIEAQWRKLVWNITFNGLTTILKCDTKIIMNTPSYRQKAIAILEEIINLARHNNISIEEDYLQKMLDLTDSLHPYKTSMMLDHENGRPLELETIYERPIEYAKKFNCPIPNIEQLYHQLKLISPQIN